MTDRAFYNFRAPQSGDWIAWCSSETWCGGFFKLQNCERIGRVTGYWFASLSRTIKLLQTTRSFCCWLMMTECSGSRASCPASQLAKLLKLTPYFCWLLLFSFWFCLLSFPCFSFLLLLLLLLAVLSKSVNIRLRSKLPLLLLLPSIQLLSGRRRRSEIDFASWWLA